MPEALRIRAGASLTECCGSRGRRSRRLIAADLLRSPLADPPPEVLEASLVVATTLTVDGYVTQCQITVENAAGDVVAERQNVDQGDYVGGAETADPSGNDSSTLGSTTEEQPTSVSDTWNQCR